MSEAEAFEVAAAWVANAITAFTIYISFTFAYLTVAFVAGNKLSRFQTIVVSIMFALSAASSIFSMINSLMMWESALSHVENIDRSYFFNDPFFWYTYMLAILGGGILVSLYFMWNVRHHKER